MEDVVKTVNPKRETNIGWRSLHYMRIGSAIAGFPLTLATFVRVFYPELDLIFVTIIGVFAFSTMLVGYIYLKKSKFFKAEVEITAEANPYAMDKVTPVNLSLWETEVLTFQAIKELAEMHNIKTDIDCSGIIKILRNSGSKMFPKEEPKNEA